MELQTKTLTNQRESMEYDQRNDSNRTHHQTSQDQTAQALIGLNVEDNQLLHIRNAVSALDAWNKLKEIHEHDSVTNIVTLIRKMYATQMHEGADLQSHLDILLDLFQKIEGMGEKISDTIWYGLI